MQDVPRRRGRRSPRPPAHVDQHRVAGDDPAEDVVVSLVDLASEFAQVMPQALVAAGGRPPVDLDDGDAVAAQSSAKPARPMFTTQGRGEARA